MFSSRILFHSKAAYFISIDLSWIIVKRMVISLFLLIISLKSFFQNSCYSKLEKADILEMTVQHLKNLKSQQIAG